MTPRSTGEVFHGLISRPDDIRRSNGWQLTPEIYILALESAPLVSELFCQEKFLEIVSKVCGKYFEFEELCCFLDAFERFAKNHTIYSVAWGFILGTMRCLRG